MCCVWKASIHTVISLYAVGHTKFAPDHHFGPIKKNYQRTRGYSSTDHVVETSSTCGANEAQLLHDSNGHAQVHFYNWAEFLKQYYKTIPSINKYNTFIVEQDQPFKIILNQHPRAEKETLTMARSQSLRVLVLWRYMPNTGSETGGTCSAVYLVSRLI